VKWDKRLITIFIIVFVDFLGGTIVLPTLPLYASQHFAASDTVVTLLATSYFAAQFIAGPILGRLSDRYGRIPVLTVSLIGTFLSFIMLGLAPNLTWLFIARILDGVTGGNVIVAQAYITDITPREFRTRALGVTALAFGLGYIIGPGIGGLLQVVSPETPFIAAGIASLLTVILTRVTLNETLNAEERAARARHREKMSASMILTNRPLVIILLICFGAQFSLSLMTTTLALLGQDVLFRGSDPKYIGLGVGLMLSGVGIGQIITQTLLIQRMVIRFGERWLVVIGVLGRSLSLLSIVVFTSPWLVGGVSLLVFAASSGLLNPALQSLATTTTSERFVGGVLGIYQSVVGLGIIIGSAIAGNLYEIAPQVPYLIGGIVLAALIIPALILRREAPVTSPATTVAPSITH
jgi:DHA1 family tetracycline resistance protein-like MFS transporter